MKGLKRLRDRGIISDREFDDLEIILEAIPTVPDHDKWDTLCDVRIQWIAKVLNEMAKVMCDLLDRQDQIEGIMDNPEYPDVETRMTEKLKKLEDGEV